MYLYNWIFCKVQAHKKNTPLGSAFPAIIFFCDANYLNHMQHLSNRWYKSDLVSQRSSKKICRSFFVSISESLVQTQLEWQESLFLMLFVCFFPFPLFEVVHKVCAPRKAGQQWLFVCCCVCVCCLFVCLFSFSIVWRCLQGACPIEKPLLFFQFVPT